MPPEHQQSQLQNVPLKREDGFNLKQVVNQGLQNWWLFLLFLIIALVSAFLYLRYTTPLYKVSAKVLIKDNKKNSGGGAGGQMFEDLGLFGGQSSVDNEVELLNSRTLMENTVAALQLNARFFVQGKVNQSEVFFKRVPFDFKILELKEDSIQSVKKLMFHGVDNRQYKLAYGKEERTSNYADTMSFNFGKLVISNARANNIDAGTRINIYIDWPDNTVADFQSRLAVAVTGKMVSTIDLALTDPVPERGALMLNTLLQIYNQMNTEDKNRVADSTITFIDNRLVYVTRELGNVEKGMEEFRQRNELTDLSAQGKLLLENSSDYFKELSKTEVQISIVQSLENYLKNERNTSRTIPAGLVINDPTFASMVEKYNTLQLEKERQLQSTTENNPVVQRLDVQVLNLKADIIANLATIKRSMEINRSQLKTRGNSFESQIQQVPRKERAFLEISRQQSIKQELYLYLLKKREETAVSKAANVDNARIVDKAKSERFPFSPKKNLVYLCSMLVGLVIPVVILFFRNLLNNKVETKKDITASTTVPIVGEIGRGPGGSRLIVESNSRHPIAEQFRLLRTNLDFIAPLGNSSQVIMLTSSMSGEGKSFLSLNLAAMLSISGKRVVLLEFDLRKPKLSKYLGFQNDSGLSSFLIKKNTDLNSLTKAVPDLDNLFFISSGPIPPNPAELLNNEQTVNLFAQLKTSFDYIILDVPPVGLVTDALLLSNYVDISLYVVRQDYTFKAQLELLDDLYRQKRLPNLCVILNDVKVRAGYGYGYRYGYGYGSYGNESDEVRGKRRSFFLKNS